MRREDAPSRKINEVCLARKEPHKTKFKILLGLVLILVSTPLLIYTNCGNISEVSQDSVSLDPNQKDLSGPACLTGPTSACTPKVVMGTLHTCILLKGEVECTGDNTFGQLGRGVVGGTFNAFQKIQNLKDVVDIAAGSRFNCVIKKSGNVLCWGANDAGQIGNGSTSTVGIPTPTLVAGLANNPIQLALAGSHSCALMSGGNIKCWGGNSYGQLGNGSGAPSYTPVTVSNINGTATFLSANESHSCAVLTNGKIKCWGSNTLGELGMGGTQPAYSGTPVLVSLITNATQVSTMSHGTCALLTNGTVKCWGSNNLGQLGAVSTNPSNLYSTVPIQVASLTTATQIVSNAGHSCAIKTNGQIKCWGLNQYGQLGNGVQSLTPLYAAALVAPLANVTQVAAGLNSSCAVVNNKVKCWGGNNSGELGDGTNNMQLTPVTTSATLTCAACTWQPTSLVNAPVARASHTMIWTGSPLDQMIVWGGMTSGNVQGDGGRFNPNTNSWNSTPMSTINAPSPRSGHSAIWTGPLLDRMIVWGGNTPTGVSYNDGGKYSPVTNSWTPTSLVGAPSPRAFHSVIWTGPPQNKMIVWGGATFYGSGTLNDGGVYDPVSNIWTPTSLVGAPSGRSTHTAVWTGTEMIVWGGYDDANNTITTLNDGARYNPTTNMWSPMSMTGAPSPRSEHTAIWTGTEMIVWGGTSTPWSLLTTLNTGARYNPNLNSWSAVTLVSAPAAMKDHSAIWTGSKMIVWGEGGAIYDPSADVWAPMCLTNEPGWRSWHRAIWTGGPLNEMIIWGGTTGGVFNTGGIYTP